MDDLQPYLDVIETYVREIAAVTQLPGEPEVPARDLLEMQARVNKMHADIAYAQSTYTFPPGFTGAPRG